MKIRSYICHKGVSKNIAMQKINKVTVDLLFCLIIGFLIIQASNSAPQNEELTNTLSHESSRISADNVK